MHSSIYDLINILFYEKAFDKYNISNKIHMKSGTIKYYTNIVGEINDIPEKAINKKRHITRL